MNDEKRYYWAAFVGSKFPMVNIAFIYGRHVNRPARTNMIDGLILAGMGVDAQLGVIGYHYTHIVKVPIFWILNTNAVARVVKGFSFDDPFTVQVDDKTIFTVTDPELIALITKTLLTT